MYNMKSYLFITDARIGIEGHWYAWLLQLLFAKIILGTENFKISLPCCTVVYLYLIIKLQRDNKIAVNDWQ